MIESSIKKNFLFLWLKWHFFETPKNILKAFSNFLLFNLNYFSIPLLLKTLFCHWRRYYDSYGKSFDIKRYAQVFLGNMISRIMGFIFRSITILIGIIFEILIFLSGIIVFVVWIFLPLIIIIISFSGIKLFLNYV